MSAGQLRTDAIHTRICARVTSLFECRSYLTRQFAGRLLASAIILLLTCMGEVANAGTFTVYGPETFLRTKAELSDTYEAAFSVLNPNTDYTLTIYNGGRERSNTSKSVQDATIYLNGLIIADSQQFKNKKKPVFTVPVTLLESNQLTIVLRGKPGGLVSLEVTGIDNDPPAITATGTPAPNTAGWNNTDVTVSFECSDAISGIATCPDPVSVVTEGGNQTVTGTATDNAGNSATTSLTLNIDKTPPEISSSLSPAPNAAGWNNSDVTVGFSATDVLSGVVDVTDPVTVTSDGANQVVNGTATDAAGNSATTSATVNLDKTAPSLTITSPQNGATLLVPQVTVTGSSTDNLSGLAGVTCNGTSASVSESTFSCDVSLSVGENIITVQAIDMAGNTRSSSITVIFVQDEDGDGFSVQDGDCNDQDPAINPGATELCNNADDNCDGANDEGFDLGQVCSAGVGACTAEGVNVCSSDGATTVCDAVAGDPADEACNGADDNCNGAVDDGLADLSCGIGACARTVVACIDGATQACVPGDPVAEICGNGIDEDCDGVDLECPGEDITPPTVSILAPASGALVINSRPAIQVQATDDIELVTASLVLTVNGQPLAADCLFTGDIAECSPTADLPEGSVTLGASIDDSAGNTGTTQTSFVVDSAQIEIEITSPADGLITTVAEAQVTGTVNADVTAVDVNGVAASLGGSSFTATVPLREGKNMLVAVATKDSGRTGTDSVDVTLDIIAPIVSIDTPSDGFVSVNDLIAVTGKVNDIVNGGTEARVFVNGVEATVAGGSFMVMDIPLVRGSNTITAVATDAVGNEGSRSIPVTFQPPVGARMTEGSGNGQAAQVNQTLAESLVAIVQDDLGNPVAGRVVKFEVTRNSGNLMVNAGDTPVRMLQVPTDGSGKASVLFTLGDTAGEGNNRIKASAVGVAGEVEFCASGLGAEPQKILMVDGDNQRGVVGFPLANPLEALVVDKDGNPLNGVEVTFSVVKGAGNLDGAQSQVKVTGADGIARSVLTLALEAGINNNVINATFAGLTGLPATFVSSGLAPGNPADTKFSGVVLDNGHTPIPGAVVTVTGSAASDTTNDEGQFLLDNVPVGHIHLHIDPTNSLRPETYPPLDFETVTVAGQTNILGQPILLPAIQTEGSKLVGGNEDVTLKMVGVAGLELTVFANSVTCVDGSSQCQVTISQVHLDKVPMPPPSGTLFMPPAWTIQPAGTRFDPPAKISIPNDGLPPGRVIDIFQFDHTLNEFINVGKGTVSDDAFVIVSDPGFGITRAGWGGCGQPQPPTNCGGNCEDGNVCNGVMGCVNNQCDEITPPLNCADDGDPCTVTRCDPKKGCITDTGDNFNPDFWNDGGSTQHNNNCYAYATNQVTGTYPQPGKGSGNPFTSLTCAGVASSAVSDGLSQHSCSSSCPNGARKIALVVDSTGPVQDYHWYREDSNGKWSHKSGGLPATNKDASGNEITDPKTADHHYKKAHADLHYQFCDICFCIAKDDCSELMVK